MDEIERRARLFDYSDAGFASMFAKLDCLHDLASEGQLSEATSLSASEVIGWLEDLIFTAEETIREIDAREGALRAFAQLHGLHGRPDLDA